MVTCMRGWPSGLPRRCAGMGVDAARGDLAVVRTGDQQGRRKGRIATREYAGDASFERDRVDLEGSGGRDRDSVFGLDKRQVRRLANGEYHAVGVNYTAIVLVKLRPEAARIIEYFDAFD